MGELLFLSAGGLLSWGRAVNMAHKGHLGFDTGLCFCFPGES